MAFTRTIQRLDADGSGEKKCIILVDDIEYARRHLEPYTSRIVASYPFISGYGAYVSAHKMSDLKSLPFVKAVAGHTTVTTCMKKTESLLALPAARGLCNWGEGVTAAVIDTGLSPHIDILMPKRCRFFYDFTTARDVIKSNEVLSGEIPFDDNGHGTAVAGILLGNGFASGGEYRGVAPRSDLVMLKAIGSKGEGGAFHILSAMQWIFTHHKEYNIRVVCMSFGAEALESNDPLSLGAEALYRSGITVVASAGNDGPKDDSIKSPGINQNIITVGGALIGKDGRISVPDFSSRGKRGAFIKPDILAPSVQISCPSKSGIYSEMTGTSMAAPIVAGAVCLMLSKSPLLTPDRVKELLLTNAINTGLDPYAAGAGLINLDFIKEL